MKFRIVDFLSTGRQAEREIGIAFAKCKVGDVDWYEKDYGIVVECDCADDKVFEFERLLGNIHGTTYSKRGVL